MRDVSAGEPPCSLSRKIRPVDDAAPARIYPRGASRRYVCRTGEARGLVLSLRSQLRAHELGVRRGPGPAGRHVDAVGCEPFGMCLRERVPIRDQTSSCRHARRTDDRVVARRRAAIRAVAGDHHDPSPARDLQHLVDDPRAHAAIGPEREDDGRAETPVRRESRENVGPRQRRTTLGRVDRDRRNGCLERRRRVDHHRVADGRDGTAERRRSRRSRRRRREGRNGGRPRNGRRPRRRA